LSNGSESQLTIATRLQYSIGLVLIVAMAAPYIMTKISHNMIQTQTSNELSDMQQTLYQYGNIVHDIELRQYQNNEASAKAESRIEIIDASLGQTNLKKVRIDRVRAIIARESPTIPVAEVAEIAVSLVDTADEFDVPLSLSVAIARSESNFNLRAVSPAGAEGVMQVMPMTAEDIRVELNARSYSRFRIKDNVRFGTYYLAKLLKIFNGDIPAAISAYNTGPVTVAKYMAYYHCVTGLKEEEKATCGRPIELYPETVEYKRKVQDLVEQFQKEGLK